MNSKIKIAITCGDTNGIGYEIVLKAFAHNEIFDLCIPVLYGNEKALAFHRKALGINTPYSKIQTAGQAQEGRLNLISLNASSNGDDPAVVFGTTNEEAGRMAFDALEAATRDVLEGLVDAIVGCPINLAAMPKDGFAFTSQNEYFGANFEGDPLMLLCNPFMRVALATNHQSLSTVKDSITTELVELRIRQAYHSMERDFLCAAPRVAVLGLNPHASSGGLIGTEEGDVIAPVIGKLEEEGIRVFGPYAADGFFGAGLYKHFDCVLAMYHDQGVTPFKALSMDEGVNFTAGLDAVCATPDHGPAFDRAGKGEASETSLLHAIYCAIDTLRHRETYDDSHANPLPHTPQRDRREERRVKP